LYSALTPRSGGNYNAMKIQGPPRVHMRSLAIAEKKNTLYASGADGRVYEGQYDKLTNQATKFSTPYPSKVIALSNDENYLVNGSDSSFVQVYNLRNGAKPLTIKGLSGSTNDVEFLPDDSGFIVASGGKTLSNVNPKTGEVSVLVTLPVEPKTLSLRRDGKVAAVGTWSGQIYLVDLDAKTFSVFKEEPSARILSVQFSPKGGMLAYGVEDTANKRGIVRLYDFTTKETRQFSGHRSGVNDVEFSPDEKLLASAGLDKRLQLYVLENPNDLPVIMDNNNGYVWDIEFAEGSSLLIAACSESEIRVWPTDPTALSELICPKLSRNMTLDEWDKFVGDQEFENTCVRLLIKDY
jgi:WD40 repeat protein